MSSKVNSALFDLVKSMSKSEKRYFKLMSSRHTIGDENNYVRLFDFLDKQEEYDEDNLFNDHYHHRHHYPQCRHHHDLLLMTPPLRVPFGAPSGRQRGSKDACRPSRLRRFA